MDANEAENLPLVVRLPKIDDRQAKRYYNTEGSEENVAEAAFQSSYSHATPPLLEKATSEQPEDVIVRLPGCHSDVPHLPNPVSKRYLSSLSYPFTFTFHFHFLFLLTFTR